MTSRLSLAALVACLAPCLFAQYPETSIRSPFLQATLYLPDPQNGYYRGTRFDRSGIIRSLSYQGHEYFGEWFDKHHPLTHDAITGPVNVFDPEGTALGYSEAKPGQGFVRIGVGLLEKPAESSFNGTHTYKVLDPGIWGTKQGAEWIEFSHRLSGNEYGYEYRKRIILDSTSPRMTLLYSLKNTGANIIDTVQFNHNFFVIDGQPSGPGMVARFGFTPTGTVEPGSAIELRGHDIHFLKSLQGQERVYVPLEGYGTAARDYYIRVENRKTGCGVRITSDRPLHKLIFWSRPRVVGPEPYIRVRVEPGATATWETRYEFYTFKPLEQGL